MTTEEKEAIKQEIREEIKTSQNGIFKKIMIGAISIIIAAGVGSFLGVRTAQQIDRERIRQNTEKITEFKKSTIRNFTNLKEDLNKIEKDQMDQWKYIIEFANTRGEYIDPTK